MDATAGEPRGRAVTNPLARQGVWLATGQLKSVIGIYGVYSDSAHQ
jgi:hypothetical protein